MARGDGKKWWNVLPGVDCVFAIDHDSEVDVNGGFLRCTNSRTLTLTDSQSRTGVVRKENVGGVTMTNVELNMDKVHTYKSVRLKNTDLVFNNAITVPDGYTMILKCKVHKHCVFMVDRVSNGGNHGFTYDNQPGASLRGSWRVAGFAPTGTFSQDQRIQAFNSYPIDTVIMVGRLATSNKKMITSYGTYEGTSSFMFGANNTYGIVGYGHDWVPDANIIAYGLLAKELTDEEIAIVLDKIEEQFLIESNTTTYTDLADWHRYDYDYNFENLDYLSKTHQTRLPREGNQAFEPVVHQTNINIKEYGAIRDYVYEEEEPTSTKLFLIRRDNGLHVATTTSNEDGYFEFLGIDKSVEYLVVAPHLQYQFKAIVKDYLPGDLNA